jgi:hypothetical protein
MRLLLVHLSDIHLRAGANVIISRVPAVAAAIRSVGAAPDACLFLVTGDIAWSGREVEYAQAEGFFKLLRSVVEHDLGDRPVEMVFIPGNHDCFLPEEKDELRSVVVSAAEKLPSSVHPDPGITTDLLSAQDDFWKFSNKFGPTPSDWKDRLCSFRTYDLCGRTVRVNLYNTAFLSQRIEKQMLALPQSLIETAILPDPSADLTISLHHHPEGWLEANFKKFFRKVLETTSDLVFTGHEHDDDYYLKESLDGTNVTYIEADALQDKDRPSKSAFNCLLIDFDAGIENYFLFRWKTDRYTAVVDGAEHKLKINPKGGTSFEMSERHLRYLSDLDFGFRHDKRNVLQLEDIFVYPSVTEPTKGGKKLVIPGDDLLERVLKERQVLFHGEDFHGKTSLLKTLCKDIFSSTAVVPVLLTGAELSNRKEDAFLKVVWSQVRNQYSDECVEAFRQLPAERRALVIDDIDASQLWPDGTALLIDFAKTYFGIVIAATRNILGSILLYSPRKENNDSPRLKLFIIGEMLPSSRGRLIEKWLLLGEDLANDQAALSKAIQTEENVLNFLIGRHVLPSLPYLVLWVLQARQRGADDLHDPGSFGYIVQRIVIDALGVTRGRRPLIERKDYLLRRLSYYLFEHGQSAVSDQEFESVVADFARRKMVKANSAELLDDLLHGRILDRIDGQISFKYEHYRFYFLALQFIDELEGEHAKDIRGHLNAMADKPLVKSNRLTLIFFLFFRKQDPIIDRIIEQADATFSEFPEADLSGDVEVTDEKLAALEAAVVDEGVDVKSEREKRWQLEDQHEPQEPAEEVSLQESTGQSGGSLDLVYSDGLPADERARFAEARLALLGQVIRNFPDSLEGPRKVEILEASFRLGLRYLRVVLETIAEIEAKFDAALKGTELEPVENVKETTRAMKHLIGLLIRVVCNLVLLEISRAVGVPDLEMAYSEAVERIGNTPATRLVELAVMLDHGETFPFREIERLQRFLPPDAQLSRAVMSDLVVRHTRRFYKRRETLRKIAGLIKVKPIDLLTSGDSAAPRID